jgi:hypothetical protein
MGPKLLGKSCYIYKDIWSSRNEKLPEHVSINSNKKYIFDCYVCRHDYIQRPNNKTSGHGCPYCSNSKLCGFINCSFCLVKSCYSYADLWSSRNDIESHKIFISSGKKYLFNCLECGHCYHQTPNNKKNGTGCPYCSNRTRCGNLECKICLSKSCYIYKELWSSKNEKMPEEVSSGDNKKYWFSCKECNHDYKQSPIHKTNLGNGCPFCVNMKRCGNLNCDFCLTNSCYIYRAIWSTKNDISPLEISKNSHKKHWFKCLDCGHDYNQSPSKKTIGRGCHYCSKRLLCGDINCLSCLGRSCYKYKDIWSEKNHKNPEQVSVSNHIKYLFVCDKCNNEYEQRPSDKKIGNSCPYCVNKTPH